MARKTNIEFVAELMNFSAAGALKQAFVIEAILAYAKQHVDAPPWPANAFLNQDAWKLCAKECLDAIEARNLKS